MRVVLPTFLGIVLMSACAEDPTGVPSAGSLNAQIPESADEIKADFLARTFALAMRHSDARSAVRDAMRASVITEHKLHLAEFARTSAGRLLITAGASEIGITADSIDRTIATMPPLDFYVPSREDRKAWKGGSSLQVGYAMREDRSRYNVYTPNGELSFHFNTASAGHVMGAFALSARTSVGWADDRAIFLLQPAERTSRRVDPQPLSPGVVIQDADDGEISGSFVDYLPNGTTREVQLADYIAVLAARDAKGRRNLKISFMVGDCTPEDPSGCGGSSDVFPTSDTTYLENVIIIGVCDNGDCNQGNEFEWHTYFSTDNGATWGNRHDLLVEGVASTSEQTWHYPALFKKPRLSGDRIQSDVVETDVLSPSDHFDPSPQWSVNDNFLKSEGDGRCGWVRTYGGIYDCYNPQPFPWREVNQNMTWQR